MTEKNKISISLLIMLAIGFLIRLFLFLKGMKAIPLFSDETVNGMVTWEFLNGHFIPVLFGQGWGGTLEAILNIPLQIIFGSSKLTLRLFPFIGSFFSILIVYKIAQTFFSEKIAITSALLTAIPVPYMVLFATMAAPLYYSTFLFCGLILWMSGIIAKDKNKYSEFTPWLIWGIAGGLSWWNHLVTAAALCSSIFFLFINNKKLFFRKGFWIGMLLFFTCSAPFWIYNIIHPLETFKVVSSVSLARTIEMLKTLITFTLPAFMGLHVPLFIDSPHFVTIPGWLFFIVSVIFIGCLIIFLSTRFSSIIRLPLLSKKHIGGAELLLIYLILIFFLFIRSNRTFWWALRYLYFAYLVIPIILAYALDTLQRKQKHLAFFCLIIILSSNIYGILQIYSSWSDKEVVENLADLPDTKPLISFMEQENIDGVYSHFWLANRLIYETDRKIIASAPYDQRFGRYEPPYLGELEKRKNISYVFYKGLGLSPAVFEKALQELGGSYKKKNCGPFTIFYNFDAPETTLKKELLTNFTVTASENKENAALSIDRNKTTRWGSGKPQQPGMTFTLTFDKPVSVSEILVDFGSYTTDRPRGLKIKTSINGSDWETMYSSSDVLGGLFWNGTHPTWCIAKPFIRIVFSPVMARYVLFEQTGKDSRFDWSIAELEVYGTEKQDKSE